MRRRRLVVAGAVALGLTLTLSGCIPALPFLGGGGGTAQPTQAPAGPDEDAGDTHGPIDPDDAVEILWKAMPAIPDDFDTWDEEGLPYESFGSDWSSVNYDDARIALVSRSYDSPGWSDFDKGPAFRIIVDLVLMESNDIAGKAVTEVASATRAPYEVVEDGTSHQYGPAPAPSGLWPHGTVEQTRTTVWESGERAEGWTVYSLFGDVIIISTGYAVPGSSEGLDEFAASFVPELLENVEELPERFDDAR